jgi:hypothetical protein
LFLIRRHGIVRPSYTFGSLVADLRLNPEKIMGTRRLALAAAVAACVVPAAAFGAAINFTTSNPVSGPSDVQNNGTVVQAYDFDNAGSQVVNGVTFSTFPGSSGDTTNISNNFTGAAGSNAQGFTGSYLTILNDAQYVDGNTNNTVVLKGLTSGTTYQVEIISYDGRNYGSSANSRLNIVSGDTGGVAGTLAYGGGGTSPNNAGTYLIGTFLANATSQTITFNTDNNGGSDSQINALVVESVPEPASLGLLALSGLTMLRRRSRA